MNQSTSDSTATVIFTFILAAILAAVPLPDWGDAARPAWVPLVLIYWVIAMPHRVGVITGSGASFIADAVDASLDALVTGEGNHHAHFDAMELGMTVLFGGHYATETFGVRALAAHLEERFELTWDFVDQPTGL